MKEVFFLPIWYNNKWLRDYAWYERGGYFRCAVIKMEIIAVLWLLSAMGEQKKKRLSRKDYNGISTEQTRLPDKSYIYVYKYTIISTSLYHSVQNIIITRFV